MVTAAADALRELTEEALHRDDVPRIDAILGAVQVPVPDVLGRQRLRTELQKAAERSRKARAALFGEPEHPDRQRLAALQKILFDNTRQIPDGLYLDLMNASVGLE